MSDILEGQTRSILSDCMKHSNILTNELLLTAVFMF